MTTNVHYALRILAPINALMIVLAPLGQRFHFVINETVEAFIVTWLSLSALGLPGLIIWQIWRVATSTERGQRFREERDALLTDAVFVLCYSGAWFASPAAGYIW
jgi:hypothetical protein